MSKRFILSIVFLFLVFTAGLGLSSGSTPAAQAVNGTCGRTVLADVVALDQDFYYNRLGAINANGMMYALARDVVVNDPAPPGFTAGQPVSELTNAQRVGLEGQVGLRDDKRPRPIVLRMNEGDCLEINFTNLLDPVGFVFPLPGDFPTGQILGLGVPIDPPIDDQPLTRKASIHIDALALVNDMGDDGSNVGLNVSSLVDPSGSTTYTYYAAHEATHLMYSMGATIGAEGGGGTRSYGLFGAVNVQKGGAEWYRSQLTREEMDFATTGFTPVGQPILNYDAVYPAGQFLITPVNEIQTITNDATGGTFTLSFGVDTTTSLAFNAPANGPGSVEEALETLPSITDVVVVSPAPGAAEPQSWEITFLDPGGQNVVDLVATDSLTGQIVGTTITEIQAGFEGTPNPFFGTGKEGLPIINMLDTTVMTSPGGTTVAGEIVHSDINAIITGPGRGNFPAGTYRPNGAAGDPDGLPPTADSIRNEPYREFTVIFHDEAFGVQAFPAFYNDPVLGHTLHGVRDSFPINYGSGGIGSEIIANRLGVGPMWDCAECKYEEFFLASSTVGDPAMIVDIPANTTDMAGNIIPGAKATKALFPEDPSNVHHSYLSDRVKFRNLHAGPKEHHIFHLHAHQWLFNPDDPQSNYLDGQAIGPGTGYTYEIAYGGSGNRNKTAGDSIFHCHFYPHFAQGMWEMWRVHDTFEQGTLMDIDPVDDLPIPAPGSRALPDGEIVAGTPIPGLVPIPTNAMAPMPAANATIVASDLDGVNGPDSSQFDTNGDGTADIFQGYADFDSDNDTSTGVPVDEDGDGIVDFGVDMTNPGYPFFIPTLLGHRPPTPAMDMDPDGDGSSVGFDGGLPRHVVTSGPDEGFVETIVSRLDFNKVLHEASAIQIPEGGTAAEQVAMAFHAQQFWPSYLPDGTTAADYETNGLPPAPGAPYAEPCRGDDGGVLTDEFGAPRLATTLDGVQIPNQTIKGANIEMPIVLNKVGWHFQQQRFEALWGDVVDTLTNARAPQPMIMRLNSTDCAEFWHTNLVPNVYELDDYQVRTPTDIIGQHIHLVKFDVMSADGSANGWNYEDGTLSPDEVRERIEAFNHGGGFLQTDGTVRSTANGNELMAEAHPFFGATGPTGQNWLGARTTIQRWYADPLLERSWDGGVGTVFTHDHYGPSTHQQVGLYSTLLVEPEDSVWRHNETGDLLGTRTLSDGTTDGGPTTWQAIIEIPCSTVQGVPCNGDNYVDPNDDPTHREFYFEFADFQHAYELGGGIFNPVVDPDPVTGSGGIINENLLGPSIRIPTYDDFPNAINPSFRLPPPNAADIFFHPNACPGPDPGQVNLARPCPEAISADDPGTYALNFRNEPIGLRVFNGQVGVGPGQTPGLAGDLAFAYQSRTDRAIRELNVQPETNGISPYPPLTADVQPGDPWTPMLRVYMGDKVRIRVQVGAHEEEHNFTIPGLKWRKEPNSPNSGWKNSEFFGIDEYFNLDVPIVPDTTSTPGRVDYIYTVGAELEGMWNGVWGILRSYSQRRNDLEELSSNPLGRNAYVITNEGDFNGICPADSALAPLTEFDVTAVRAVDVLPGLDGIIYNDRTTLVNLVTALDNVGNPTLQLQGQGPLIDPTALMYVLTDDLVDPADPAAGLKPGTPVEPLILRVNAGDCVQVNLTNALPADLTATEMDGFNALPPIVHKDEDVAGIGGAGGIVSFNANDIVPSSQVGLTPQLLAFDPRTDGGFSTGLSTGKLVAPGRTESYRWYAGDVSVTNDGVQGNRARYTLNASPVEFGAVGLMPADRIKGSESGFVGAMVVEPQDACWITDPGTRAQATVWKGATDGTDPLIGECPSVPVTSDDSFRDFVTVMQNDVNLRYGSGVCDPEAAGTLIDTMACAVPSIAAEGPAGPPEDPQDTGQKAINYGADPLWFRLGIAPNTPFGFIHRNAALASLIPDVFANSRIGDLDGDGINDDPQTEVYRASPNGPEYGRFRVLMPGGHARGTTYTLHGHEWQGQPYTCGPPPLICDLTNGSSVIGDRGTTGVESEYYGTQEGINPTGHWEFVTNLGGYFDVTGDYLWRDQASFGSYQGLWGLLRFDFTPPVAADLARSIPKYDCDAAGENCTAGTADINLLQEVFDLDGDTATGTVSFTQPSFGNVTDTNGDGIVTFTYPLGTVWPCANAFACSTTFTYTVTDAEDLVSDTGTVTITVTNTAPVANNDTAVITGSPQTINVPILPNDFDAEGDKERTPLTVHLGTLASANGAVTLNLDGTVQVNAQGELEYTWNSGNNTVDRFSYTVTDESGATSNEGMVRVAINVDNIVITNAQFQDANGRFSISGTCSDPNQTLTIYFGPTIESDPVEGDPKVIASNVDCLLDNTWSFSGIPQDSTIEVSLVESNFVSAESTGGGFYEAFLVTLAGPNIPPVAVDDPLFETDENTSTVIDVLANDADADGDELSAVPVPGSGPAKGTLTLNPDGTFTYDPNGEFEALGTGESEQVFFSYVANDGKDDSAAPALVTITITGVNDAPNAEDDGPYSTDQGVPFVLPATGVLANDSDVEGDAFTLDTTPVSGPAVGNTVTLSIDGSFTYTPDPFFTGTDSFVYHICEDANPTVCGEATVTINVGVNNAPVAVDNDYVTQQNTALTVNDVGALGNGVLANDTDADNDPLTVVEVNGLAANVGVPIVLASGATLEVLADGSFTYTPLFNFTGVDSFTYVANDGTVDSNTATVTISINDIVTVSSATYRTRQNRWNIEGNVSVPGNSVDVYLNSVDPANLIGSASVAEISGDWSFTGTGAVGATAGDTVIAVSSGGGVSAPFPVNVRQ